MTATIETPTLELVGSGADGWSEGIVMPPGPVDAPSGDGTHDTDLSDYFDPAYAVVGVVGTLVIIVAAFTVAMRRRLRAARRVSPAPTAAPQPVSAD